ncbi:uncharacterized protein with ParB-like and HNH nuclease domain [Alkalihalobacillus xiaoxiensis]|uniref:Uncharacterized protein with ParB-like and HNH nuclease domain n=1 Tax=Shouchella xiaoxiensis TaxID=766895 RepID=A0ABS2SVN5_9BACI|nr:DUF262 domain-containing protein [Shouchella xiaoxiensis]MBM7839582.1 uncharacterized protein with ParB-like and HNH nuclease domain [Shouchella xiaoxiensis]
MSYQERSIKDIIKMIGRNEVYLPAIQRKFIWKHEQIERLFDSIMRGYPIGTFLFWYISGEKKNNYTFYKFLQNYHERGGRNEVAPNPQLKDEIIGVLDGQQRLSSMYIALQGSYAYKKAYARWDNDNAFPKRYLYINLMKNMDSDGEHSDDLMYQFKFLTEQEAKLISKDKLWFKIKNVLTWGDDPEIDDYYDKVIDNQVNNNELIMAIKSKKSQIKSTLRKLHMKIVLEKLINDFKLENQDLDEVLDIFVRVNSGGTVLSKSDLLFSTIVANWEEARDEIEDFLIMLNNKGDGFKLDNDFIMRSCLVLTDCPVLFSVKNFRRDNITRIRTEWPKIKEALSLTIDLIVKFGFSGDNLTSHNALVPIAYFILKGGNVEGSEKEIQKYLINSLLMQIYGGQGDQVLTSIRDELREVSGDLHTLKYKNFPLKELLELKLPGNKSLKMSNEDLDEILEYKKSAYTFMVLSLLYPNLRYDQISFHQDHIHPSSFFTDSKLKKYHIPNEKWDEWKDYKDTLPNLQMMEGKENISKSKKPVKKWLEENTKLGDKIKYRSDNYIPMDADLDFFEFEAFYESRKKLLKKELSNILL